MARGTDPGGRQVYRPVFARVLLVVVAAFALWWEADLLVHGRLALAVLGALWTAAAACALVALFWRPAVIVDDEGAELRNVLRDVRVPWAALDGVETRYALTLVSGGRRYTAWAAPTTGRPPRPRPSDAGTDAGTGTVAAPEVGPASRHLRTGSGVSAFLVEERWAAWQREARKRAFLASRNAPGGGAAPGDSGATVGDGGPVTGDGAAPGPVVRWRPWPLAVAPAAAALALVLAPALT